MGLGVRLSAGTNGVLVATANSAEGGNGHSNGIAAADGRRTGHGVGSGASPQARPGRGSAEQQERFGVLVAGAKPVPPPHPPAVMYMQRVAGGALGLGRVIIPCTGRWVAQGRQAAAQRALPPSAYSVGKDSGRHV